MKTIAATGAILATLLAFAGTPPDGGSLYENGVPGKLRPCASCHGAEGQGGAGARRPRLAGLPRQYLARQLKDFRTGKRRHSVMTPIAANLSDADIQALAAYLSRLNPAYRTAAGTAASPAGALLAAAGDPATGAPACRDCHGPALAGGGPDIPPLVGQSPDYLLAQLEAYKSGGRSGGPLSLMAHAAASLDRAQMRAVARYIAALDAGRRVDVPQPDKSSWKPHPQDPNHFVPPPVTALPAQRQERNMVLLGERIFDDTPKYAAQYVDSDMSCRNCHLQEGRSANSAPMWAAVPRYPTYRGRSHEVTTLVMRNQSCFRFSENGAPPPADSRVMVALLTYMHWLASGLPTGITPRAAGYPKLADPPQAPDRARGKAVYARYCALCHGDDGQGRVTAGARVFPPLWGPRSFNWGAGMHRVNTAAAFVYANMPFGAAGRLHVQQAWDVAAWLDSQPRPQDPRFAGNLEQTRDRFHRDRAYDYYGRIVDGLMLGAPGTLAAWERER